MFEIKKIIPLVCNTSNHTEYQPWIFKNNLVTFDKDWYDNFTTQEFKNDITELLNRKNINIEFNVVTVPHEPRELTNVHLDIYKLLNNQYDFDKYYDKLNRKCIIVKINNIVREELIRISKILIISGRSLSDSDITELCETVPGFIYDLRIGMKEFSGFEVFVKTVVTSGKNDGFISPCSTYVDVLKWLTNNILIYRNLVRPEISTDLILQKWIDIKYEFRVFVFKSKVTAISQQKWYEPINIRMDLLISLTEKILNADYSWIPTGSGVVDVCFINNGKMDLHMIECNPWGNFLSSGSSLFSWIDDYDILYGKNSECVVRIYI